MKTLEKSRLDTRLSKEQKEFFEYAANIGGFKTLTEFIINSVQSNAEKIIEKHEKILASNKDKDIFFNELLNPSEPNKALKDAAAKYKTKPTAVEWLVNELSKSKYYYKIIEDINAMGTVERDVINTAKQMEEEQIMDTMCQQLQIEVNVSETQKYYKSKEVQDLDNPTDVVDEYSK